MALLTDEQLHQIRELIRAHHSAFVVNTVGPEAVSPEVLEDLQARGLIDVEIATIEDAYLYGQALAAASDPNVANMSLEEFKGYIRENPVPLSDAESRAVDIAKHQAAQFAVGLGNRIDQQTGQILIEADAELRAQRREEIRTATAEAIAKRKSIKQLVSDLKWKTKEWARDWDRIAVTEKHTAMQRGVADSYLKHFGDGVRVAKRPTPDACAKCKQLHLSPDGQPRIFKLRDLEKNGTNYGRKARDWLPVVGGVHPWCQCQIVRIPEGWGFDEAGDLVPGGELGSEYESPKDLERALQEEDELLKAFKLQGHTQFQGIPIAIENRKGTVRRWTDDEGNQGKTRMRYGYGYAKRTSGADGEEIDVYVGPDPRAPKVFLVHQLDAATGRYDEDKVFLGLPSAQAAKRAYLQHVDNPEMFGGISAMDVDQFKRWIMATEATPGHTLEPNLRFTLPTEELMIKKEGQVPDTIGVQVRMDGKLIKSNEEAIRHGVEKAFRNRGPALVVTGKLATEVGAQTSPAAERSPGHGTWPNFPEFGGIARTPVKKRGGLDVGQLSDDDHTAEDRQRFIIDADTRMPPEEARQDPRPVELVDRSYYRGPGPGGEENHRGLMTGPMVHPGRMGDTRSMPEDQDWHPQEEPGIDERYRVLSDGSSYEQALGEVRGREPVSVPPGVHIHDEDDQEREKAERERLEAEERRNRQRPRNNVDVEES